MKSNNSNPANKFGLNHYCVVTLHRQDVDIEDKVVELVENLVQVSHKIPIIFQSSPDKKQLEKIREAIRTRE